MYIASLKKLILEIYPGDKDSHMSVIWTYMKLSLG